MVVQAATNAMTLLNVCRESFDGRDLSKIRIVGADLSGADLEDTRLVGADVRDVNFFGSCLRRADFSGANLSGAGFGGTLGPPGQFLQLVRTTEGRLLGVRVLDKKEIVACDATDGRMHASYRPPRDEPVHLIPDDMRRWRTG